MASTIQQFDFALKKFYKGQNLQTAICEKNALLDMITKDTSFAGSSAPLPILYGGGEGFGVTLSGAQADVSQTSGTAFEIKTGNTYTTIEIDDKVMSASRVSTGAFLEAQKAETDAKMKRFGNVLSAQLLGLPGGSLGVVGSVSGGVITLASPGHVIHFTPGQKIVASTGSGASGSDTKRSGTGTVTAINADAGTVTYSGTITSIAANDYIFRSNMFSGDITQTALWSGIPAWIPDSAPSSTAFFNVDRTVSTALSGTRVTGTGGIQDRLLDLCTKINTIHGGTPGLVVVDPMQWKALSITLENQGVRAIDVKNSTGTFGYKSLQMITPYGAVDVISDRMMRPNRAYALNLDHVKIWSQEEMVHIMNRDGNDNLRMATASTYEWRFVSYANVAINAPWEHGTVDLVAV